MVCCINSLPCICIYSQVEIGLKSVLNISVRILNVLNHKPITNIHTELVVAI